MWWMMAWSGNGFECSMKEERMCTMRRKVGVCFWWMMIWCVRSTKECVTTDVSQFLIYPCTFLRYQGLYSVTLSVVIWVIGKCVHDGCPRCSQTNTKNSVLHVLWHFWSAITRKEMACWAILWQETRHGCPISHLNQNNSPCIGSILACWKRKNFKQTFSTRKIMCTLFWDRQGALPRIFAPRHNSKLCCLLWNAEEAEVCNSKQKAWNAECHHSFASW